jgi:hypothetical protein
MLKEIIFVMILGIASGFSEEDEQKVIDSSDQSLVEAEKAYQAALEEMRAKELQKIRNQNIGESYLEKVQKRYVSRMPYVMVPLIVIPVVKKHEVIGYLTIMPEIKGKDVEAYRKIVKDLVLLRDAIYCDLFSALNRLWIGPEPPSADTIAGRIKKCVTDVCKSDIAEKVTLHILNFNVSFQAQG